MLKKYAAALFSVFYLTVLERGVPKAKEILAQRGWTTQFFETKYWFCFALSCQALHFFHIKKKIWLCSSEIWLTQNIDHYEKA